jgi:hypothetical protein
MKKSHYSEETIKAAKAWWASLPGGKKRYLKEHNRLTNDLAICHYYTGCIKPYEGKK